MKFNDKIKQSATLKFAQSARERRARGQEIISLGLGEPDFRIPSVLIDSVTKALTDGHNGYSSPLGNLNLRKGLAENFAIVDNINCSVDNIMIVPGAKQAIQLSLMSLLEPNDEVIVINPSFVSFEPQVYFAEPSAVIRTLDLGKKDLSLSRDLLSELVSSRTKVIIINSPNNPTGAIFSREDLRFIYNLAEEYDFYIISDEVYKRLNLSGAEIMSIGSFETEPKRVFTVNGYSKSHGLTGWRIGYVAFPKEFQRKLLLLQQHINTNTCTFIQEGLSQCRDLDMGYLESYRSILKVRLQKVVSILCNSKLKVLLPSAGFFVFIDISSYDMDSNTFCSELMSSKGVALTPGIAFGDNWDDHVRLSIAVDDTQLHRGVSLIIEFLNALDDKRIVNS